MSFESVLKKCLTHFTKQEIAENKAAIIEDIQRLEARFEKFIKVEFNKYSSNSWWNALREENETVAQVRNRFFEIGKKEIIQQQLVILCDLFDVKLAEKDGN